MLEVVFMSFFVAVICNFSVLVNFLSIMIIYLLLVVHDSEMYLVKCSLILLSIWLIMMMILSVNFLDMDLILLSMFMLILIFLEICFYCDSMIFFYLMFEMSIIPIFMIIFGWGYQSSRVEASIYMIGYTVMFSLPFLIMIMFMSKFKIYGGIFSFFCFFSAFLVKFPLFGMHLWLPRAHVEAPVFGSMVLAGVMLKLGGYGVISISCLLGDYMLKYGSLIIVYAIMGSIYLSLICFLQVDLKVLIAYSSIVHMGLVLSGLFTMREICLNSSVFMMIGHGLCSSGLFYMVGIIYSRVYTRSMLLNSGLSYLFSLFSLFWFFFCSSNLSFPPCLNFGGELGLFVGIMSWNLYMSALLVLLGVISSMYSVYLYSYLFHGEYIYMYSLKAMSLSEFMVMILHWVPLNLLLLGLKIMCWY